MRAGKILPAESLRGVSKSTAAVRGELEVSSLRWYLAQDRKHQEKVISFIREFGDNSILALILLVYSFIFLPAAIHFFVSALPCRQEIGCLWLESLSFTSVVIFLLIPGSLVLYIHQWQKWTDIGLKKESHRTPPRLFAILKRSERSIENIFLITAVINQGLHLFARIHGGPCHEHRNEDNTTFCNLEWAANGLPQDTAFALILLPGILHFSVQPLSFWVSIISSLLSAAILLGAIAYASAWRTSSVLLVFSCFEMLRIWKGQIKLTDLFRYVFDEQFRPSDEAGPHSPPEDHVMPPQQSEISVNPHKLALETVITEKASLERQLQRMEALLTNIEEYLVDPLKSISCTAEEVMASIGYANAILGEKVNQRRSSDSHVESATGNTQNITIMDMEGVLSKLQPCGKLLEQIVATCRFATSTVKGKVNEAKLAPQVDSGILVPVFRTVSVIDVIDWSVACIQSAHKSHKIIFKGLNQDIFPFIITDGQWLSENLICALSNAVKFSYGGEIEIYVSLSMESKRCSMSRSSKNNSGKVLPSSSRIVSMFSPKLTLPMDLLDRLVAQKMLRFTIVDSGLGIDPDLMRKVFLSPAERKRRFGGSNLKGIGLYNMFRRVDALGGSCGIAPRPDGHDGSVCWFSEPYRPDVNPVISDTQATAPNDQLKESALATIPEGLGGANEDTSGELDSASQIARMRQEVEDFFKEMNS